MPEHYQSHENLVTRTPEWNRDIETSPLAELIQSNAEIAPAREEIIRIYAHGPMRVVCPDGRVSTFAATSLPEIDKNDVLSTLKPEDFGYIGVGLLGGTIPENRFSVNYLVSRSQTASALHVMTHTDSSSVDPRCGALALKGALNKDKEGTLNAAKGNLYAETARWTSAHIKDDDPGRHAIKNSRRGWRMIENSGGKRIESSSSVFDHVQQRAMCLEIRLPLGRGGVEIRSIAKQENIDQWQWDRHDELPLNKLTDDLAEMMTKNLQNARELHNLATSAHFENAQSFRRVTISDNDMSIRAQLGPIAFSLDSVFNSTIPVDSEAPMEEFQGALTAALAAAAYGIAHANADTDVHIIVKNRMRGIFAAEQMLRLPAMQRFMKQPDNRSLSVITYNEKGDFQDTLLIKPSGVAVSNLQLPL